MEGDSECARLRQDLVYEVRAAGFGGGVRQLVESGDRLSERDSEVWRQVESWAGIGDIYKGVETSLPNGLQDKVFEPVHLEL